MHAEDREKWRKKEQAFAQQWNIPTTNWFSDVAETETGKIYRESNVSVIMIEQPYPLELDK